MGKKKKFTIAKKRAMENAKAERRKKYKEIYDLKGREKIEYEIGRMESQIKNIEADIESFGDNKIFRRKLEVVKDNLNKHKKKLERMKNGKL